MTTNDKGRFVAIKLGLWHEGPNIINKEGLRGAGAPPPPDFLSPAGADLLLRTLLAQPQKYGVDLYRNGRGVCACRINDIRPGYGATWPEALLDAAFKALEEK